MKLADAGSIARILMASGMVSTLSLLTQACRPSGSDLPPAGAEVFSTTEELRDLIATAPLVQGPFSEEAIAVCEQWGTGSACRNGAWGSEFLEQVRSYLEAQEEDPLRDITTLSLTDAEPLEPSPSGERCPTNPVDPRRFAYGPFTQRAIRACENTDHPAVCHSNCWDRAFFEQIRRQVRRQNESTFQAGNVDENYGRRLATKARSMARGFVGRCWKWVNDAIVRVTGHERRMLSHSKAFLDYARSNPRDVKRTFGLCLSPSRSAKVAPVGSVLVYSPGYCGFNRRWGHGEIKVSNTLHCSDGCMNTAARCPYPTAIFLPCGR